jgi:ferric-dicitrate binding protein FerR (iron transport regulator)
VEVLGTEFLVSDRKSHSSIVLKSGKVKVDLQADTAKSSIYLKPGELAEVRKGKTGAGYLTKSQVNPELYYSWTQGKWRLEGTSLGEMLLKLQDTYGINTVVENKNLLQRRASGSIPLEQGSATVLLTDIATLFELKVTEKKDGIYLEAKH